MNILEQHTKIALAEKLLLRGMRLTTVKCLTDLSSYMLTEIHREITGNGAECGRGRQKSTSAILSSDTRRSEASIFVKIYLHIGGDPVWTEFDIEAFIRSYDVHCETMSRMAAARMAGEYEQEININYAWALARDIRSNVLRRRKCHRCKIPYVYLDSEPHTKCPLCATLVELPRTAPARRYNAPGAHSEPGPS